MRRAEFAILYLTTFALTNPELIDPEPATVTAASAQPRTRFMPRAGSRPTLLVFTLGASAERRRRPLLPGRHADAEVALRGGLLDAALAAGREVGCRLRVSCPEDAAALAAWPADVGRSVQRGRGFGERLEAACAAACEEAGAVPDSGAAPLLVVGADVPGLAARHLRAALDALADEPEAVVLGPSPDGGFYLLATARPLPGLARLTRWCRPDTLARLRRSLAALGRRVVLLEPLADLDRRGDLERWLALGATQARLLGTGLARLARRLARLLADLKRPLLPTAAGKPHWAPVPVRTSRAPPRRR